VLKLAEFKPMAFGRLAGGTTSLTKDCRAGLSKVFAKPSLSASR